MSPKMLGRVLLWEGDSGGRCPNCDVPHSGICPCAWCDQLGHIVQDCMAHFADDSMQARFPKRERIKKIPIKHYECHRCGGSHPFNIYCPNVREPPVIPGECRSCGTTTREHANDCQYVAIKDNIGLCTYCQAQDHWYAACPRRAADQEIAAREKRKNRKNNKKKGKVKIIAGIMTREQESDSTLSPGKEEEGVENTYIPKDRRKTRISVPIAWWVRIATGNNTKRCDVFLLWR